MQNREDNKKLFTLEDFEKGLMLAGYMIPMSQGEIEERERLAEYEKVLSREKRDIYFKRAVLAAEIASQLYSEMTFGRVKFQKLVYLCENVSLMDTHTRYAKFAAGPFDPKFMHSIDREFKKQKWFEVKKVKEGPYNKSVYQPLENQGKHRRYFENYFEPMRSGIQEIIDTFRTQKTREVELVATIFYVLLELKTSEVKTTRIHFLEKFYDFAKEKEKFSENEVLQKNEWMQTRGLTPVRS